MTCGIASVADCSKAFNRSVITAPPYSKYNYCYQIEALHEFIDCLQTKDLKQGTLPYRCRGVVHSINVVI